METIYGQIMKNMQLFKRDEQSNHVFKECKDCFSCNIIQIENIVDYFKKNFDFLEKNGDLTNFLNQDEISSLISRFIEIASKNKLQRLQQKIISILSSLILLKTSGSINYQSELQLLSSPKEAVNLLTEIMRTMKHK